MIAQGCRRLDAEALRSNKNSSAGEARYLLLFLGQFGGELSPSIIFPQASPAHHRLLLITMHLNLYIGVNYLILCWYELSQHIYRYKNVYVQ